MIRQCAGSLAARRRRAVRLRPARWAASRRIGWRQSEPLGAGRLLVDGSPRAQSKAAAWHRARYDSSVSPTHGEQEESVWNGHYECICYHPLFVFNQFGDLERCVLEGQGDVHSADDWEGVLKPVIVRSSARK